MDKLLLIARVSDIEQRQALPAQKLRLDNYAQQFSLPAQYFEFDESAYKGARQKFAELIEKIQTDTAGQIIVFDKIDRFTRDASQKGVRIMSSLVQRGKIELHFPSDNLTITKDSPATDLFRLGIGMLLAKYYSDAARDNVKRRFEQMRHEGLFPHQAPFGYRHTRHHISGSTKAIKTIEVDPVAASAVALAFELRSRGLAYSAISAELAKRGFVSPRANRPFRTNVIARMMANQFYIGIMTIKGCKYPHKHPQLISKQLFNRCQLVKENRQPIKARYNSKEYIFKGIVACGDCARSVSSYSVKGNVYLKCANPDCKQINTAESLLLPAVETIIKELEVSASAAEKLQERQKRQATDKTAHIRRIKQESAEIDSQFNILYSDRLSGRIAADRYDRHAAELENKRQSLKKRSNFLTSAPKASQKIISQMVWFYSNSARVFKNAENRIKNLMLEILLSNLKLKNKKLSFSLNFPSWGFGEIKKDVAKLSECSKW